MNDWDNLDNFPADDDDNDDLSWLNEDDDDLDWLNSDDSSEAADNTDDVAGWSADDDDFDLFAEEDSADDDNFDLFAEEDSANDDFDLFAEEDTDDDFDLFAEEEALDDGPQEWQMPRPNRAERDIAAAMEDAETADFGDTDEMLDWMATDNDDELLDTEPPADDDSEAADDIDLPDWLSGMDLPDASDEEIAAARDSVDDTSDDDFGAFDDSADDDLWGSSFDDTDDVDDSADTGWGSADFSDDEDADDLWGTAATSGDTADTDDDDGISWGDTFGEDSDLIPASADDADDLSWLGGDSDTDDDAVDDFAAFMPDTPTEDTDDFAAFMPDTPTEDTDDFAAFMPDDSATDDDDVDDFAAFLPDADEDSQSDADDDLSWLGGDSDDSDDIADDDDLGWFSSSPDESEDDTFIAASVDGDDADMDDALDGWGDLGADFDDADDSEEDLFADEPDADTAFADADEDAMFNDLIASLDTGETYAVADDTDANIDDEDAAFNDLIAGLDDTFAQEDDSDDDLDDLLMGVSVSDDDSDLDDLLAELDTGEGNSAELDDLLAELDTDTTADADDTDFDLDDLLGASDAVTDEDEPAAADLDFLDEAEPAADLDFLDDDDMPSEEDRSDEEYAALVGADTIDTGDLDFMSELDLEADTVDAEDDAPVRADAELDFISALPDDDTDLDDVPATDDLDDFFASFDDDNELGDDSDFEEGALAAEDDFLADFATEAPTTDELEGDFFADLDAEEDAAGWFDEAADAMVEPAIINDEVPDWLDEISGIDTNALQEAASKTDQLANDKVDVDALIASFGDDSGGTDDLAISSANLGAVLDQLDEEQRSRLPDDLNADELPEWLREIASGSDAASAVAVIRERRDRSVDDLDDRLRDLRDRGLEISTDTDASTPANEVGISTLIPNIDQALTPAATTPGQTTLATAPIISPDQEARIALLQSLVSATDTDTSVESDTSPASRILSSLYQRLDRVVVALVLLAAVLAPFAYPAFNDIAALPPGSFATQSPEFAAFTLIDNLDPEDYVLIAAEYGATGARELDAATQAFMEHIITIGGKPVIVSSNAIGILRAESIAVDLLGEDNANDAFYVAGFLPGGTVGLRDFALNVPSVLASDVRGEPTELDLTSLDQFSAIVLISESGETVRNWMEQIAPITDTEIVVVTGQAARPLALPYVSAVDNAVALLVGYDDAYTYQQMALGLYNPSATPSPLPTGTDIPTETPTLEPTATDTPEPTVTDTPESTATDNTDEADSQDEDTEAAAAVDDADSEEEDTVEDTDEADVADEEEAAETEEPTATTEPSATATEAPRGAAEDDSDADDTDADEDEAAAQSADTETESDEEETEEPARVTIARVITDESVNVRSGAGESFPVIGRAEPDTPLAINDETTLEDDWINVVLPDGTSGWIASFLVEIETISQDEFDAITVETVQIGTIVGDGRVNVRSGPASTSASVAGLDVGTQVRVLGFSEDGEWVNVILPNETEGWVARFLIDIDTIPADEWEGADRRGFYPVYFSQPQPVSQDDDEPTVIIATNVAGFEIPLYADVDLTTEIGSVPSLDVVLVLDELPDQASTFVQLEDGGQGYVESRLIRIETVAADTVDFLPTATPTPTLTPTSTLSPTPTITPTPTTFVPQLTPAPPTVEPTARAGSQTFGLVMAIIIIALGNLFWIFTINRRQN